MPKCNFPFVSRTTENNWVNSYVDIETNKLIDGNCIIIDAQGIYSFYQPDKFATVLNLGVFKYSYGRAKIIKKLKMRYQTLCRFKKRARLTFHGKLY